MTRRHLTTLSLLAATLCAAPLRAQTFNFEGVPVGTSTPFDNTVGGLTASFSSPDGNVFSVIGPVFFNSLSGNALLDDDPDAHALLIHFSSPLTSISLNFALNSVSGGTFTLAALSGSSVLGTTTVAGTVPDGFTFLEGTASFSGLAFDNVRLTSNVQDFAVDNIAVRQATTTTPEPATLALLLPGAALVGLGLRRRRA